MKLSSKLYYIAVGVLFVIICICAAARDPLSTILAAGLILLNILIAEYKYKEEMNNGKDKETTD